MSLRFVLFLCAALLPGCFYEIGALDPPSTDVLARSTQTVALRLGSNVNDTLMLRTKTDASVRVSQWHETLLRGFHNGVEKFFAPAPSTGPSDFTIVIHKTEITLARYKDSELHFEADLLDGKQAVVKTWNTTVRTRVPLTGRIKADRWTPFGNVAAPAIATLVGEMYDDLAGLDGLFAK